jgi:ribosomal protein S27AE
MAHTCRQCGSERIAPAVRVAPSAPSASLLAQLRGRVCADCGYTELFADNAMGVFLAHQREVEAPPGPASAPDAAHRQCPRCGSLIAAAATSCDVCGWTQVERA